MSDLFAAEPAGDAGLGLGGLGLDLAVELVHLLHRAGLDVLCVRLGVGAGLGKLRLRLSELWSASIQCPGKASGREAQVASIMMPETAGST